MQNKKAKTYHYSEEMEKEYFFVMINGKCCCLICNASISLPKRGNLERHFKTIHKTFAVDYPLDSELRKCKIMELKTCLSSQQSFFTKLTSKSKAATAASFRVSYILAKNKKSFSDGVIVKEAFLEAAESLFCDFENKSDIISAITDMQLSRNTVTRRVVEISSNLKNQLMIDIENCTAFSLQADESTDVADVSQLIIFIRMVFKDFSTKEELLTIIPLKSKTRGEDIFQNFKTFANSIQLQICKLVSITTDGAPAMTGRHNGFIAYCKNDCDFPDFLSYHCIIHQQALCAKTLNMTDIMDITFKIANSIRARSLHRRLFKLQVEESNMEGPTELLMHTDVRWLSRGKFLQRFRDLLSEIKLFLASRGDEFKQLEDDVWLLDLAFLVDITAMLNELNLDLQGKDKLIFDMISSINAFTQKLQLIITKLDNKNLTYFPNMLSQLKESENVNFNITRYAEQMKNLVLEFERRFQDFQKLEIVAAFMSFPFNPNIKPEIVADSLSTLFKMDIPVLEMEIITLQNDIFIKSRSSEQYVWKYLSEDKYSNLKKCFGNLVAFFGSTYLCESAFSHMKIIKSKYRATLTDDHLECSLRSCLSTYIPNYKNLVDSIQCRASTSKSSISDFSKK